MGLFGPAKMCALCGGKVGLLGGHKLANGLYICGDCTDKCTPGAKYLFESMSPEDVKSNMALAVENKKRVKTFSVPPGSFIHATVTINRSWKSMKHTPGLRIRRMKRAGFMIWMLFPITACVWIRTGLIRMIKKNMNVISGRFHRSFIPDIRIFPGFRRGSAFPMRCCH